MSESTQTVDAALLPFLGVLRVGGTDAAQFLQGQLTNDTRLLEDGRTQLTALNTPQGRVVALLRLCQSVDAIYALLPGELLESVRTHLQRYVLRARVKLEIATDLAAGWIGVDPLLEGAAEPAGAGHPAQSPARATGATPRVVFDYAPGRQVIALPQEAWRSIAGLSPERPDPRIENTWHAADIAAGLPQVFGATSGSFVPQMLNLDLLQAISFDKGCYTGQEIVARTQHLGRIKRRMFRFEAPGGAPPAIGEKLLDGEQPCGEVVLSAGARAGSQFLAVVSVEHADHALRLATQPGRLSRLPMHYPVAPGA